MRSRTNPTSRQRRSPLVLTLTLAAAALVAVACSAPESQPPPASLSTADPSAQSQPSEGVPPAQAPSSGAVQQPASQPAAAAAPAPAVAPAPAPKPAPPKPRVARLNAGQVLTIRTTRQLSTSTMKTGDVFAAVLEEPIVVNGWTVAAGGAKVEIGRASCRERVLYTV